MEAAAGEGRRGRILASAGLFALALAVRALPFRSVFANERVYLFGNDAYYHLRRIAWSVARFPAVLEFDPFINFPDGARPIWTPVFDWCVALAALPFVRADVLAGDLHALERLAAWIPPVLGALTVVALYGVARRHFDEATALLAGLILCVLSAHFWYSQLGFVDHHVAVALVSTAILGCGMRLLAGTGRLGPPVTGATLGLALLVWPGALLHVLLLEVALALDWLRRDAAEAAASAKRFAAVNGVACLCVLPSGLGTEWPEWGRWSPVVLSAFQPWFFAALCVSGIGIAALFADGRLAAGRQGRVLAAFAVGAAVLGVSLVALPGLADGASDAWSWFSKGDAFQARVAESEPLIPVVEGRPVLHVAARRLSLFFFGLPLALLALGLFARRRPCPAPFLFLAGWTAALCAATLVQKRFFNSASVAVALVFAWSAVRVYARLGGRSRVRRALAGMAVCAGVGVLLLPVFESYRPDVMNVLDTYGEEKLRVYPRLVQKRILLETGDFLRVHTPEVEGWLSARAHPAYGVLAPWSLGHALGYASRRPTVTNNFGNDIGARNYELARGYYALREASAVPLLEHLRVRYVVALAAHGFLDEDPGPASMHRALFHRDGSALAGNRWPALTRHRLIYESRPLDPKEPRGQSLYKVFEFVAGARVSGRAAPGAAIEATLPIRTNRKRRFLYRAHAVADADGRYRLVLPYANEDGPRSVRVSGAYRLACGEEQSLLVLPEEAVTAGLEIAGPDLCPEPRAAGRPSAGARAIP